MYICEPKQKTMSNFKVTEDYLINIVQGHEFKTYIREHIEKTNVILDELMEMDSKEHQDLRKDVLDRIDKDRMDDILKGKTKNKIENIIYKDFMVEKSKHSMRTVWNIFLEKDVRKLVLTEKCLDLISTMKLDKSVRYDFLKTLPNRIDLISLDKHNCVLYKKTESRVLVIFCNSMVSGVDSVRVGKKFLDIDLLNEHHYTSNISDIDCVDDNLDIEIYSRFVQIVSFIELGNTNFKIVPPKDKVGNFMKNNECRNLTKKEFIVVDTDWNDISIRMEGFPVKGHLRLQRCGVGRTEFKVIYIQPFMKHGYNRNHLKNGVNVENIEFEEVEKV